MQEVYEIETRYTFEEYKRYVYDLSEAQEKVAPAKDSGSGTAGTLILVYLIGMTLFLLWGAFRFNDIWFGAGAGFFVGFFIIGGVVTSFTRKNEKKKPDKQTESYLRQMWESDKTMRDCTVVFGFGEIGFSVNMPHSHGNYSYSDICYLIETPTNFYIMMSLTKGYIINKENTDKDARQFIRLHCGANRSVSVDI